MKLREDNMMSIYKIGQKYQKLRFLEKLSNFKQSCSNLNRLKDIENKLNKRNFLIMSVVLLGMCKKKKHKSKEFENKVLYSKSYKIKNPKVKFLFNDNQLLKDKSEFSFRSRTSSSNQMNKTKEIFSKNGPKLKTISVTSKTLNSFKDFNRNNMLSLQNPNNLNYFTNRRKSLVQRNDRGYYSKKLTNKFDIRIESPMRKKR